MGQLHALLADTLARSRCQPLPAYFSTSAEDAELCSSQSLEIAAYFARMGPFGVCHAGQKLQNESCTLLVPVTDSTLANRGNDSD